METPHYQVARLPRVTQQMRALTKRAKVLGIKTALLEAFESLDRQLQRAPLSLGNPVHTTKKRGGIVCVAIVEPISIRFAVYEDERAVILLDINPLTRFFPD